MSVKTNLPPTPLPAAAPTADPLAASLHVLQLEGTLYCRGEASAPWSIAIPGLEGCLNFVVVTSGRCWLMLEGRRYLMEQGSLALLPHPLPHTLCSDPDLVPDDLFSLPITQLSDKLQALHHGGGGEVTRTLYGVVRFDQQAARYLMKQLPPVVRIDSWEEDTGQWLQSTLQLIAREARDLRPGGDIVITRLADILVIQAIRAWLDGTRDAERGWIAALRDANIGQSLALIHDRPAADWSVAGLARAVGMSRSAFAARFTHLLGCAPMAYVAEWRLNLARGRISGTGDTLSDIALAAGYQSVAAFSRAFRRQFGASPGSFRAAGRTPLNDPVVRLS